MSSFWQHARELVAAHAVVIDRPAGSTHPRFPDFIYPLDYGYLEGTSGGDGQGIDVWLGSGDRSELTGVLCSIDLQKRDAEVKLLLGCTAEERELVLRAHNRGTQAALLVPAPRGRSEKG
jgi:inorganic pyrophosphatase